MSNLELARTVADAVLYEGYLLYPYRSTSRKNVVRWQFGVLGPPGAAEAGVGEESGMAAECLLEAGAQAQVEIHLRFLQLQSRFVEQRAGESFTPVPELSCGDTTWVSWDEAVAQELCFGPFAVSELGAGPVVDVAVEAGEDVEALYDDQHSVVGRLVRRRWPLEGQLRLSATADGRWLRLAAEVDNTAPAIESGSAADKDRAIRASFIGTHLLLAATDAAFVSLLEPPEDARAAAQRCQQRRCWPVLTGGEGESDVVLASPIILYDYPAVAPESAGALFDSTEIDEILTLRVMTLTDEEKAAARATDAHAAAIIDRCDNISPEQMQRLHGILRDPHAGSFPPGSVDLGAIPTFTTPDGTRDPDPFDADPFDAGPFDAGPFDAGPFDTGNSPWWDPAADASVEPETDTVVIDGVPVGKGSLVRVVPKRRADAQDLFSAGKTARVTSVLFDVDGDTHVAVVLVDDPAAELHDWYGRYLYFSPDELEPLSSQASSDHREESRS
jgi:hypothetical protein